MMASINMRAKSRFTGGILRPRLVLTEKRYRLNIEEDRPRIH